jgi:hypothetical protein
MEKLSKNLCLGKCPLEDYPSHPPPHRIENPLNNPDAKLGSREWREGGKITQNYAVS